MEFELPDKRIITVEEQESGSWSVDGEEMDLDVQRLGPAEFHVIQGEMGYRVFIEDRDEETGSMVLRVNGERVDMRSRGRYESLLESLGMKDLASSKAKDLKAPMPGLVIEVFVSPGDEVEKGQKLLVLEAMKMENIIKAEAPGLVKDVLVKNSDSVEKNEVLIHFEA
ncbi:MAG: biotin/lipoyl-binding protein [Flavobacteriales bacterium]|nr:biotin/lipoyl-binding protein [Flavobacteriales bacterium]